MWKTRGAASAQGAPRSTPRWGNRPRRPGSGWGGGGHAASVFLGVRARPPWGGPAVRARQPAHRAEGTGHRGRQRTRGGLHTTSYSADLGPAGVSLMMRSRRSAVQASVFTAAPSTVVAADASPRSASPWYSVAVNPGCSAAPLPLAFSLPLPLPLPFALGLASLWRLLSRFDSVRAIRFSVSLRLAWLFRFIVIESPSNANVMPMSSDPAGQGIVAAARARTRRGMAHAQPGRGIGASGPFPEAAGSRGKGYGPGAALGSQGELRHWRAHSEAHARSGAGASSSVYLAARGRRHAACALQHWPCTWRHQPRAAPRAVP